MRPGESWWKWCNRRARRSNVDLRNLPKAATCSSRPHVQPKLELLDCLKACADRANLDADDFWLHKFHTLFVGRVDLWTVQQWLEAL